MTVVQSLFLSSRVYKSFRKPDAVHEEKHPAKSLAWCCPQCGDIWARAVTTQSFMFLTHVCEKHLDPLVPSLIIPGSLLWTQEFNESLPLELWMREVELHIAHRDRIGELDGE